MSICTPVNEHLASAAELGFCRFAATDNCIPKLIQNFRQLRFAVTSTSLSVKSQSVARPNTLSARYGAASFPFHTDFAFCAKPARYILLANSTALHFSRPTLVAKIGTLKLEFQALIRNSVWKLQRAGQHYLVNGQFVQGGEIITRWDCDFLEPANDAAVAAARLVPPALADVAELVDWEPQNALLIDNWSCAHARAEQQISPDPMRTLLRYEFWSDARMVR